MCSLFESLLSFLKNSGNSWYHYVSRTCYVSCTFSNFFNINRYLCTSHIFQTLKYTYSCSHNEMFDANPFNLSLSSSWLPISIKDRHCKRVNIDTKHDIIGFTVLWQSRPHIVSFSVHRQFKSFSSRIFGKRLTRMSIGGKNWMSACLNVPREETWKQQISGPDHAILFTISIAVVDSTCRCYSI